MLSPNTIFLLIIGQIFSLYSALGTSDLLRMNFVPWNQDISIFITIAINSHFPWFQISRACSVRQMITPWCHSLQVSVADTDNSCFLHTAGFRPLLKVFISIIYLPALYLDSRQGGLFFHSHLSLYTWHPESDERCSILFLCFPSLQSAKISSSPAISLCQSCLILHSQPTDRFSWAPVYSYMCLRALGASYFLKKPLDFRFTRVIICSHLLL